MQRLPSLKFLVTVGVLAGITAAGYLTRDLWMPMLRSGEKKDPVETASETKEAPPDKVILTEQAQENLGIQAKPLVPQTFWKTVRVPGMVVDLPGHSDRGVVAPADGVIVRVNCFPGDIVRPGDELFTIKLVSDSLHLTLRGLFTATQDIKLTEAQRKRLAMIGGAIPEARLIELENQITRLQVSEKAYRQELIARGLPTELIEAAAEGDYINEVPILVPNASGKAMAGPLTKRVARRIVGDLPESNETYEVQDLKAKLGRRVEAGQTLCVLANHRSLAIEGRAFRDDMPYIERSSERGWPAEVDFGGDFPEERDTLLLAAATWGQAAGSTGPVDSAAMIHAGVNGGWVPPLQDFTIRRLSPTIDPETRVFTFLLPLENQARAVERDGRTRFVWRYRPGQKVRVLVRVERLDNVFVLPADAVAFDGTEPFVFTQNVNTFERKPVRVLSQNRKQVVISNDGSMVPGTYVVQSAAPQLNRMVKAGSSAIPKGYHIHADGSLHKNEDEGK